jgi:hypothetical protein
MAKLEVMLEQRGIVSPREIAEAVARCELHGGDLTTSLLQFVNADESQLSAALSECHGLPAAIVGVLPTPDEPTSKLLPREIAERYCCFPLESGPGRLVLAVPQPFEAALKEDLCFALGVNIEERVALEVRVRQAISRHYGLPLSSRNQRGVARLDGDLEGSAHETPWGSWPDTQLSSLPRPPSDTPLGKYDSSLPAAERALSRQDSPRLPSTRPHASHEPSRALSERPRPRDSLRPMASVAPPSSGTRSSRRRGPVSLGLAREELGRATSRNEVLETFFGFACQFFEYAALFAVKSALAEGLNAWGPGADRDVVLGIGVPLDLPSSLSEAAESGKMRLTRLGREGIDRTLSADLRRQLNTRVLILPVCLRGRCAVLLYADNGSHDVVEREIEDVVALAPDVANALGRIILQRKRASAAPRSPLDGDVLAPGASQARPSSELAGGDPAFPSQKRDKSRNNARSGSRPDAAHAPLRQPGETALEAARAALTPDGEPAADELTSPIPLQRRDQEDPVFLLARPMLARSDATPALPDPALRRVAKPPIAITLPARVIQRPRLPSVILAVDAMDAAVERPPAQHALAPSAARPQALAVTRPPLSRLSAGGRRPFVPPPAEPPSTPSSRAPRDAVLPGVTIPGAAAPRVAAAPASLASDGPTSAHDVNASVDPPLTALVPIVIATSGPASGNGLATTIPAPNARRNAAAARASSTSSSATRSAPETRAEPTPAAEPASVHRYATAPSSIDRALASVEPRARAAASAASPAPESSPAGSALPALLPGVSPFAIARSATRTPRPPPPDLSAPRELSQPRALSERPEPGASPAARAAHAPVVSTSVPPNAEIEGLVELLCQGNSRAAVDLGRIGSPTLPQLMARFPGPVISERAGPALRASECGPLLAALAAIGTPATPKIARSSEDQDARVRRWATLLLGELPGPEACRAVVQRLADEEPRVQQAALDAARLLLESSAANLFRKTLFEVAEAEDAPLTLRLRTIEHVAKLKDSASVPRLIAFLGADTEPIVHKALWALSVVTRQDFGRDTQSWRQWWHAHQELHRCQWLIEALDHADARQRKAASEELQIETQDTFGYAEDLALPERRQAQRRYQEWWEAVGTARFGRSL